MWGGGKDPARKEYRHPDDARLATSAAQIATA
jgi:hypothetical protein